VEGEGTSLVQFSHFLKKSPAVCGINIAL